MNLHRIVLILKSNGADSMVAFTDFCAPLRCAQAYGVRKGFIRALNGTTPLPSTRSSPAER